MSSGVMNFKDSSLSSNKFYGQSYQPVTVLRASHSNRRFIKGYIILYIVRIFSSSEPVEPHSNSFQFRLAVALKEEAKCQVFVRL